MMAAPGWTTDYIRLPFRALGRDRSGLDCWGLVRLVLHEQTGITLPEFAGIGFENGCDRLALSRRILEYKKLFSAWREVDDPRAFDLLWMRVGRHPYHFGVVAAPGVMLHIERGAESCLERFDGPKWRNRVLGVYRHAK